MTRRPRVAAVAALLALLATATLRAENPRAELGKRLRRFEIAWQGAEGARRAAALDPMNAAVKDFFTLRLPSAAARLDEAWFAVRGASPPDAAERRAIATAVTVEPLLADVACDSVSIRCEPFYAVTEGEDAPVHLLLRIEDDRGTALAEHDTDLPSATGGVEWTTGPLPEGDHRLVVERRVGDGRVVVATIGVSRVADLDRRRTALRDRLAAPPASATPTARASAAAIGELLGNLAASRGQETDFPAARLLAFAESLLADGADPDGTIGAAARRADCWLTLSDGRAEVPVRLRAPAVAAGPSPVLFLLHGAGGSENMFFETCGAGRAVALGLERGWLVVAPRQGLFGLPLDLEGMLGILDDAFPIDRSRVFVAGHSMGAMQTARQVALHPASVAAAAAIGGGGTAPAGGEARRVPWFVAAGAADFGRPQASALARALRAAGNRVEERIVPDVEHMVVVQAALDDLFAFLDRAATDAGATDDDVSR